MSKSSAPKSLPAHPAKSEPRFEATVIEAAWLYYHEGLNQNEIADRMRISRASVVNYLGEARSRGWIRVYLDSDVFLENRLSEELRGAYGLTGALVAPDDPANAGADMARVARAAADWLPRLLAPGDRLGVSWGETIYQVAQQMTSRTIENLSVVQLVGSRPAALGFAAEACTSMIAQKLGGDCINLHVPLLLSNKAARNMLCDEPVVADQLAAVATCNKTVLACGTCDVDAHIVKTGLLDPDSISDYRRKGAVGVICGRLIDAGGAPVRAEPEDRMIGVSLVDMRGKDMALLVAAGKGRAIPANAAIKGGYVTHLATSTRIARELIEMAP
ncbi:sugar-binding transcriptional regulator [Oricola sp.]|uniref:sugar-binding transcriptional regulator n=1 Tax=Oricola sp. TaxID=1979950 RepID=UPI003BA841EA